MKDGVGLRVAAIHECFDKDEALLICQVEHLLGLVDGDGGGFFAEYVFAGAQGFEGPVVVQGVGQTDVDGLDLGIGEQVVVAGVADRGMVLGGKAAGVVSGA